MSPTPAARVAPLLKVVRPVDVPRLRREPFDGAALAAARRIVAAVRRGGEPALRRAARRLGDLRSGEPLLRSMGDMAGAFRSLPAADRALLLRTAARVRRFAQRQRRAVRAFETAVPGGRAGHDLLPVARAGCYAPGGRHPLPSSVLMTAVVARAAGVGEVWVASPRPAPVTLAAAWVAGADGFLAAGGAQAVAALAYGAGRIPPCDVVVGPGNAWVTAAKWLVSRDVGIDILAGPSELTVLAGPADDPALVAADLLAQAEHDPRALPVLVTTSRALLRAVETELARQLADLPTAGTARRALANGFAVLAGSLAEAIAVCDRLAPEHLAVLTADPAAVARRVAHCGGLFIGAQAAEVLGDYGAGPNHVLPTGGTARFRAGLSVLTFLRARTWMRAPAGGSVRGEDGGRGRLAALARDAARLARLEGLEAHARAAERRLRPTAARGGLARRAPARRA